MTALGDVRHLAMTSASLSLSNVEIAGANGRDGLSHAGTSVGRRNMCCLRGCRLPARRGGGRFTRRAGWRVSSHQPVTNRSTLQLRTKAFPWPADGQLAAVIATCA